MPLSCIPVRPHLFGASLAAAALALQAACGGPCASESDCSAEQACQAGACVDEEPGLGAPDVDEADEPADDAPRSGEDPGTQANWSLNLPARLPAAPRTMAVYRVVADAPLVSMSEMQRYFGLRGVVRSEDVLGGVEHLVDGALHAYVFRNGSAAFHDTDKLGSEVAIRPLSEEDVWRHSDLALKALGLLTPGAPTSFARSRVGEMRVELHDVVGGAGDSWVTQQIATYDQYIDGWPAFGNSQVEVTLGDGGAIWGVRHSASRLAMAGNARVITPEEAVRNYERRAAQTGRYNLFKAHLAAVSAVSVDKVRLGYFIPDPAARSARVDPVYEFTGTASGLDEAGESARIDLYWIEPALRGRAAEQQDNLAR